MGLKNFLTRVWQFIQRFFNSLEEKGKIAVHIAVEIVENIKKVSDTPLPDVLAAIIPGDLDDEIIKKLRSAIPDILDKLKLFDACGHLEDSNELLQCVLKNINLSNDELKNTMYHGLSTLLVQTLSDGKLTFQEAVLLSEYYYKNFIKDK